VIRFLLLFLVVTIGIAAWPVQSAPGQAPPPVPLGFLAAEGADFFALRAAGAVAVKLVASWPEIEARQGAMLWEALDEGVNAARAAGLRVILVLSYTPKWASSATGAELLDPAIYERQLPKRIEDWETFVTTTASRYRDRVKDWQIWTGRSLSLFRGTMREYIALLRSARMIIKATDPSARIVLSTPHGVDLPDLRRLLSDVPDEFDIVSLSPRGVSPDALLRPLGVIRERLLPRTLQALWIEWDPHTYGLRASWPGQLIKLQAMAKAAGVEHIFWTGDATAITRMVLDTLGAQIGRRPYTGYVTRQRALLLVFGGTDPAAVAWSGAGETMLAVEGSQLAARAATGDPRPVAVDGEKRTVAVGTDPLLLTGIGPSLLEEARQVPPGGFPVVPGATDHSQAQEVSASLGRTNVERGLYNSPYREWRNEARDIVVLDGVEAVRANSSQERVFVHFDVDDTFLFFVDGRAAVDVIVEVRGASAPQQLGFSLLYDSMSGYRFSPWQWVDVSPGWVSYTFRLTDAAFSDTWGWDFAVNAAGNRTEDLTIRSVTVKKVAP
jgi:hypothetical protein